MMNHDYRRTTITVPTDLKERMQRAGGQVNWSAVACEAFEKKLAEIGPIQEITSLEDAVERMKAIQSGSDTKNQSSPHGLAAGRRWAMNQATPDQLQRIEAMRQQMSDSDWSALLTSPEAFRDLARCIDPHAGIPCSRRPSKRRRATGLPRRRGIDDGRPPAWERDFWSSILDERPNSPGFFLEFADGALEIWKQIKDQF